MATVVSDGNFMSCLSHKDAYWCDDIKEVIESGNDASWIFPGSEVLVPLAPTISTFVLVEITNEPTVGSAFKMRINHTPDFGKQFYVDLGLWNEGEGRISIRSVIIDILRAEFPREDLTSREPITAKCPSKMHAPRHMLEIQRNTNLSWKLACLWYMFAEKACLPCYKESANDDDYGVSTLTLSSRPWQ